MIIGGNGNDTVDISNVARSVILGDVGTILFSSNDYPPSAICVTSITSVSPIFIVPGENNAYDMITTSLSQSTIAIGGNNKDIINCTNGVHAIICGDHCNIQPNGQTIAISSFNAFADSKVGDDQLFFSATPPQFGVNPTVSSLHSL
jgi:hypothetical protein